jgi:hypothetical protein
VDIRDNLLARIGEAEREGWVGEAEGLKVSLAAANAKLAQLDNLIARRSTAIDLGMPTVADIAIRTLLRQGNRSNLEYPAPERAVSPDHESTPGAQRFPVRQAGCGHAIDWADPASDLRASR